MFFICMWKFLFSCIFLLYSLKLSWTLLSSKSCIYLVRVDSQRLILDIYFGHFSWLLHFLWLCMLLFTPWKNSYLYQSSQTGVTGEQTSSVTLAGDARDLSNHVYMHVLWTSVYNISFMKICCCLCLGVYDLLLCVLFVGSSRGKSLSCVFLCSW